jgi:hypothetical protein
VWLSSATGWTSLVNCGQDRPHTHSLDLLLATLLRSLKLALAFSLSKSRDQLADLSQRWARQGQHPLPARHHWTSAGNLKTSQIHIFAKFNSSNIGPVLFSRYLAYF